MALVLLFLIPLSFTLFDVGRCIYTYSVVQAAAQEGARVGIIDDTRITARIRSVMIGLDMENASIVVDTSDPELVVVSISYQFTFVTPFIGSLFTNLVLSSSASMATM